MNFQGGATTELLQQGYRVKTVKMRQTLANLGASSLVTMSEKNSDILIQGDDELAQLLPMLNPEYVHGPNPLVFYARLNDRNFQGNMPRT